MVFSGSRPSMIAASPNWRSRSRRSVRFFSCLANGGPEVGRGDGLAGAALRREHGDDAPAAGMAAPDCARPPRGWPCGWRRRRSRSSAAGAGRRRCPRRAPPRASTRTLRTRAGSPEHACARGSLPARRARCELRVPWRTTCRCPPVRVAADSRTPSLEPTISTSECRSSASRSSGRPSQLPVTKTRTFSRIPTGVSRLVLSSPPFRRRRPAVRFRP